MTLTKPVAGLLFLGSMSLFLLAEPQVASGTKKLGEVEESADSYRDPGFSNQGASQSRDPSILNFKGNRAPGLPEKLKEDEIPKFPNFRFAENGKVILYGVDRNGKRFEEEITRADFDQRRAAFEKSELEKSKKTEEAPKKADTKTPQKIGSEAQAHN